MKFLAKGLFQIFLLMGGQLLLAQVETDTTRRDTTAWPVRVAEKLFGESSEPGKPKFLVYPTLAYAPETSLEIGLSALYLFHARNDYQTNRLSEIQAFTFFTLNSQYGLWLDHAVYGHEDRWITLGRIRLQRFPLLYYGVGPNTLPEHPAVANADYLLVREDILKQTLHDLFVGFSLDYQQLFNSEFEISPENPLELPLGATGSRNVGLGGSIVYDTRTNVLNERDAFFAELSVLNYNPTWGSDYAFNRVVFDGRGYFPMTADKKQVLAAQVYGNFMRGDSVPFNMLSLLGNESLMRGYYTGRFRDRQYMAAQVEYRFLPFPFSRRIGGTVFMGVGTVAPTLADLRLDQLKPAGGLGVRVLLFPEKDIFVRLEMALTPEGPNFYFFTGEAF